MTTDARIGGEIAHILELTTHAHLQVGGGLHLIESIGAPRAVLEVSPQPSLRRSARYVESLMWVRPIPNSRCVWIGLNLRVWQSCVRL